MPIHNLKVVARACDELNQQAGHNKAIPHVAARNIKNEQELEDFIKFCISKGINKALVIGGSTARKETNVFNNDVAVANILKGANITVDCGIYPQNETALEIKTKLDFFENAITQLCMNPRCHQQFHLLLDLFESVYHLCVV